ncbi:hypothetical protein ACNKHU_22580 [Shigella flexneri]
MTLSGWRIVRYLIAAAKAGMDSHRFRHGFGAFYLPALRTAIKTEQSWQLELAMKMRFYSTLPALMLTVDCLKRCWVRKTPLLSDALNHASIIDRVRLCKAKRYRYANNDMQELEARRRSA